MRARGCADVNDLNHFVGTMTIKFTVIFARGFRLKRGIFACWMRHSLLSYRHAHGIVVRIRHALSTFHSSDFHSDHKRDSVQRQTFLFLFCFSFIDDLMKPHLNTTRWGFRDIVTTPTHFIFRISSNRFAVRPVSPLRHREIISYLRYRNNERTIKARKILTTLAVCVSAAHVWLPRMSIRSICTRKAGDLHFSLLYVSRSRPNWPSSLDKNIFQRIESDRAKQWIIPSSDSFSICHECWLTNCRVNCPTIKHRIPKWPGFSLLRSFLVAFVVIESINIEKALFVQQHQIGLQCIYFANRSLFPSCEILHGNDQN